VQVYSSECRKELDNKYITVWVFRNFSIIMDHLSSRNSNLSTEMLEVVWRIVLLINEDFIPYITLQRYNTLGGPTHGGWTYTWRIVLNVKLWPEFKIPKRQSYGIMWPTVMGAWWGGQLHRLYCRCLLYLVLWSWKNFQLFFICDSLTI